MRAVTFRRRPSLVLSTVLAILLPACLAAASDVTAAPSCGWDGGFGLPGLDGTVHALATFDDGHGLALYAGGSFRTANGITVNNVARWDGQSWQALTGLAGTGTDDSVWALAVFDDGRGPALYAGGSFNAAGGESTGRVARWDGTAWTAVHGEGRVGPLGQVLALAVFDDGSGAGLYAGGTFRTVDGIDALRVARWNGTAWAALSGPAGNGVSATVRALAVHDDGGGAALYVGGSFSTAGGLPAKGIARWRAGAWSALTGPAGNGVDGSVFALASGKPANGAKRLFVGGDFAQAGGHAAASLAAWAGSDWAAIAGAPSHGVDGFVTSLQVLDDGHGAALFAGGAFAHAAGVAANGVARWDGSVWQALGGASGNGLGSGQAQALARFDTAVGPRIYVGGAFDLAGGQTANNLAAWTGSAWIAPVAGTGDGVAGGVEGLTANTDASGPTLWAGGGFTAPGGVPAVALARWNGSAWTTTTGQLPAGSLTTVLATLADEHGSSVYAGGLFDRPGSRTAPWDGVARWDGAAWVPLTAAGPPTDGFDNYPYALAAFGGEIYVGGVFDLADGVAATGLARWDGTSWGPVADDLGGTLDGGALALATFDDGHGNALYAGGYFRFAGSTLAPGIARWDGSAWSAVAGPEGGLDGTVQALAVVDDGHGPALYAGGDFVIGDDEVLVAKWDGTTWTALPGLTPGADPALDGAVYALAAFDDGHGARLVAGGNFGLAAATATNIARWTGSAWQDLAGPRAPGIDGPVLELATLDDGTGPSLYAGGYFAHAGGLLAANLARYDCRPAVFLRDSRIRVREHFYDHATPRKVFNAVFAPDLGNESFVASAFSAANKEQLGKVLDACALNQKLWFFYGTASDTEHFLSVEDLDTGRKRLYHNGDHQLATTTLDTGAFACATTPAPGRDTIEVNTHPNTGAFTVSESPGAPGPCVASPTTKCLLGGKFEVRGRALDFASPPVAHAATFGVDLGTQSFLSTFFSPTNFEQLGKVLDGCAINQHYWLFATNVTNVDLTMTVRRTADGVTRTYHKPANTVADALTDLSAFTCP